MRKVPQKRHDIYNFKIDWALVDKHALLKNKIAPWLAKKSLELFGSEGGAFVDIVMKFLAAHEPPSVLTQKLEKVLDENAEEQVCKLYRTLIFEILKVKYDVS